MSTCGSPSSGSRCAPKPADAVVRQSCPRRRRSETCWTYLELRASRQPGRPDTFRAHPASAVAQVPTGARGDRPATIAAGRAETSEPGLEHHDAQRRISELEAVGGPQQPCGWTSDKLWQPLGVVADGMR